MAKLYFRYGVMGSSKTANALMVRYNYEERGQEALLSPNWTSRTDPVRGLPGRTHPCIYFTDLKKMTPEDLQAYACIIVDEAQFLTRDEVRYLTDLVDEHNVPVICYGLRTDFKGDLFPALRSCWPVPISSRRSRPSAGAEKRPPATPALTSGASSSRKESRWCWGPTTAISACAANTGRPETWAPISGGRADMICDLCPRRCGAVRTETAGHGRCRMPSLPVVARAALHLWEEPPISGTRGAGTVFFSGCPLGCVFCQNESISHDNFGKPISVERLRVIFLELIAQGTHNIDLVNPTHFAHAVGEALSEPLPCLWCGTPAAMTGWRPCTLWRERWISTCLT